MSSRLALSLLALLASVNARATEPLAGPAAPAPASAATQSALCDPEPTDPALAPLCAALCGRSAYVASPGVAGSHADADSPRSRYFASVVLGGGPSEDPTRQAQACLNRDKADLAERIRKLQERVNQLDPGLSERELKLKVAGYLHPETWHDSPIPVREVIGKGAALIDARTRQELLEPVFAGVDGLRIQRVGDEPALSDRRGRARFIEFAIGGRSLRMDVRVAADSRTPPFVVGLDLVEGGARRSLCLTRPPGSAKGASRPPAPLTLESFARKLSELCAEAAALAEKPWDPAALTELAGRYRAHASREPEVRSQLSPGDRLKSTRGGASLFGLCAIAEADDPLYELADELTSVDQLNTLFALGADPGHFSEGLGFFARVMGRFEKLEAEGKVAPGSVERAADLFLSRGLYGSPHVAAADYNPLSQLLHRGGENFGNVEVAFTPSEARVALKMIQQSNQAIARASPGTKRVDNPLVAAARAGDAEAFEFLLKNGATLSTGPAGAGVRQSLESLAESYSKRNGSMGLRKAEQVRVMIETLKRFRSGP